MNATRTIVVVSDDAAFAKQLENVLTAAGYLVLLLDCRERALHLLTQIRPQLVVLDSGLPDLPAVEFISSLRPYHSSRGTPVVLLYDDVQPLPEDYPYTTLLAKPCTTQMVYAIIEQVFAIQKATCPQQVRNLQRDIDSTL